jgi:hypothetical protein
MFDDARCHVIVVQMEPLATMPDHMMVMQAMPMQMHMHMQMPMHVQVPMGQHAHQLNIPLVQVCEPAVSAQNLPCCFVTEY